MNLTINQLRWLDTQGGRTEEDLHVCGELCYILCSDGVGGQNRVVMPSLEELKKLYK